MKLPIFLKDSRWWITNKSTHFNLTFSSEEKQSKLLAKFFCPVAIEEATQYGFLPHEKHLRWVVCWWALCQSPGWEAVLTHGAGAWGGRDDLLLYVLLTPKLLGDSIMDVVIRWPKKAGQVSPNSTQVLNRNRHHEKCSSRPCAEGTVGSTLPHLTTPSSWHGRNGDCLRDKGPR